MIVLGMLGATTLSYRGREVSLRPTHAVLSLIFASVPGNALTSHDIQRLAWPGQIPGSATAANLRSSIRMFRRSFAAAIGVIAVPAGHTFPPERAIVAGHSGYQMFIAATDADAFSRLATEARLSLEAGRPEAAWMRANEALKLWRGAPLADAGSRSFAVGPAARLNEIHVAVRLTRAEAAIWRGTQREIIGELRDVVAGHPDNFDAWYLLVNALARSGRTAEAADASKQAIRYAHSQGIDDPRIERLQHDLLNTSLPLAGSPWPGPRPRPAGVDSAILTWPTRDIVTARLEPHSLPGWC